MKKKIIGLVLVGLLTVGAFVGCGKLENKLSSGGLVNSRADYVVINYSGGEIFDIWKLDNAYVENGEGSDGYEFTDNNGNFIRISGDVLVIRCNKKETFNQYEEYHKYSNN